jgi:molybdate transport system substrate-binding protein
LNDPLTVISSMATKAMLAELLRAFELRSGLRVKLESVGGVVAAQEIRAGKAIDVVVLARGAIEKLLSSGHILAGSDVDVVTSLVAVAVRAGAPRPYIGDEESLKRAVLAARTVGYSTGPSGVELAKLFARWGIAERMRERIVTPEPGTGVGMLVARGEVELGFQQLAELVNVAGIDVLGPLPASIQIVTTFSAAVGVSSKQAGPARSLIAYMTSPDATDAKRRHGMHPAPRSAEQPGVSAP